MTAARRETIHDLPPSAKLLFKIIEQEGSLTKQQLVAESRLSKQTTRLALNRLKDADLLDEAVSRSDARQSLYSLTIETLP